MTTPFQEAFTKGTDGLTHLAPGANPACPRCQREYGYATIAQMDSAISGGRIGDSPHFSHHPCNLCGSTLSGDRYTAHAHLTYDNSSIHLDVCTDCLFYIANGDLPDNWSP